MFRIRYAILWSSILYLLISTANSLSDGVLINLVVLVLVSVNQLINFLIHHYFDFEQVFSSQMIEWNVIQND